jgi:hypothetical protein
MAVAALLSIYVYAFGRDLLRVRKLHLGDPPSIARALSLVSFLHQENAAVLK